MKNLLKLSLLLSVLVVGGLNAGQQTINGKDIRIPDEITIVNDTGADVIVDGKLYTPGTRAKMMSSTLKRLNGSIDVKQGPKDAKLTFAVFNPNGMLMESMDFATYNLSDVLNNLKDADGYTKSR